MSKRKRKKHSGSSFKMFLTFLFFLVIVAGGIYLFFPLTLRQSVAPSFTTYAQSESALRDIQKREKGINPLCYTRFLTHGQKTDKVIIFFHGFTSCPKQFEDLAASFYNRGYNVVVPLIPHHGNKDLMTEDLKNLTAEELALEVTQYVGISKGWGMHVSIAGLSGGGNMAGWAAQNFDIDQAVLIDPMYTNLMTQFYFRPITHIVPVLPPFFMWWDSHLKDKLPVTYTYPRYPIQAAVQFLKIGNITYREADKSKPKAKSIVVVTNANDTSVDNKTTALVVADWKLSGAKVSTYQFSRNLGLSHDIIAPEVIKDKKDLIYGKLYELIVK